MATDGPQAPPLGIKVPFALPVYSVETGDEMRLIVAVGELKYTEEDFPIYVFPNFNGKIEDLDAVTERLHELYQLILSNKESNLHNEVPSK